MKDSSHVFELKTGRVAIGDPAMGLARYSLNRPPGLYRLSGWAFLMVDDLSTVPADAIIDLNAPYVFVLDEGRLAEFERWYHQVGNECSYMVLAIVQRLPEFETAAGTRVGFYWEREVAGENFEGQYILDPDEVLEASGERLR
jgi:hypothetical protein